MNFSRINLAVLVAVLAGCSSQPVLSGNDPTEERLRAVGQAYGRAADAIEPGYEAASAALASVDLDDWR